MCFLGGQTCETDVDRGEFISGVFHSFASSTRSAPTGGLLEPAHVGSRQGKHPGQVTWLTHTHCSLHTHT